jgi:hypothetical protein
MKDDNYKWGKTGGSVPYGYIYNSEKNILEPMPNEVQVLQKIFRLAIAGYGGKKIANELNEANIPTRHGAKWSTTTVDGLLTEKRLQFYMGYHIDSGKKGDWFPILLKSVYDRIPVKTDKKKKYQAREKFLLSGHGDLFICGHCNSNVKASVTIKPQKRILYYLCTRKQINGTSQCPDSKLVRQEIIDKIVLTDLKVQLSRVNEINKFITTLREFKHEELKNILGASCNKINKVINKNVLSIADLYSLRDVINLQNTIEEYSYFFSDDIFPVLNKRSKNDSIERNIDQIILYNDRVDIRYRFPINEKLEAVKTFQIGAKK